MKTRVVAAALSAMCGLAQAGVIDFNPAAAVCSDASSGNGNIIACANGSYIAQSYGDVAGTLDVQYAEPRQSSATSLRWWDGDYNTLHGVAWADSNDNDSKARIDLLPLNDSGVTLTHFDMGAYPNTARDSSITISAIGGPVLFSYAGNIGIQPGNLPSSFDGSWSSASGIRIEWQDSAYNNGIDNISYQMGSVTPVPEPATFLMLALGLVYMAGVARSSRSELFR